MVAGLCQLILASKSVRKLAHQKPQTHKQAKNKNTKQSIRANESSAKRMGADHPYVQSYSHPLRTKSWASSISTSSPAIDLGNCRRDGRSAGLNLDGTQVYHALTCRLGSSIDLVRILCCFLLSSKALLTMALYQS